MSVGRYEYQVVTHNGSGVHHARGRSLQAAQDAARSIAAQWADVASRVPDMSNDFEIERVLEVRPHSFRYWMRRRGRWVLWDPHQDAEVRRPDFVIRVLDGGEIVEGWPETARATS